MFTGFTFSFFFNVYYFFFFKQKTAYEMRISDWSSDVCSSDLVYVGTQSTGQGHETAYTQIVAEQLGVDFDKVRIRHGDSDAIPTGGGTAGARSLYSAGGAILKATDGVIEKGKAVDAEMLATATGDIAFPAGRFPGADTDRGGGLAAVA